ncbi:membrane protein insertion efficiency factor [Artemisia annua]|uniref:Membrane protein insertion efficiency factor n=1 Tax=Artemisia annua TaxID=35608 RepID=A0A2U1NUS4_ARTAN|nr:membrane protein insertion efficiency factor [Artemisia annua]
MAVVCSIPPNSTINPNFKFPPKLSSIHHISQPPYLHFRTKSRRLRFSVVNELGNDSEPSTSQGDYSEDFGVKVALSMLRFYKSEISPLLPKSCRYVPTCSEYSMIAYKKYGVAKGSILTVWRICRCNPLGGSGFDPPRWFDEPTPPEE